MNFEQELFLTAETYQNIQREAFKQGYNAGYEAGKNLHQEDCVKVKDETEFYYDEEFINDKNAMCEHTD